MFGWLFGSSSDEHAEAQGERQAQSAVGDWEELGYDSQEDATKWMAWEVGVTDTDAILKDAQHRSFVGGFLRGLLG